LTVDTRTFAAQLIAVGKRYPAISTSDLVQRIRGRERIAPTTIAIHFDDCYRDILVNGAPILKATGYPALAFVSSGFVDTDRAFAHDREKYPFQYPNLRTEDIRAWVRDGLEMGAHTVNHTDLGPCDLEEARFEIIESRVQLETIVNGNGASSGRERTVAFFSFPFGRIQNIRAEVVALIREAGYSALFSAHGGFVGPKTDLFDVPRIGCSGEVRPLDLLLEIEGLAPGQLAAKITKLFS
jgi:peptidoglycan/xylan/chitin deacetylase (PgdA/CDA1 family)